MKVDPALKNRRNHLVGKLEKYEKMLNAAKGKDFEALYAAWKNWMKNHPEIMNLRDLTK